MTRHRDHWCDCLPPTSRTRYQIPNRDIETTETKWLGVILDENLNFKKQKLNTISKGTKRINFLTSLSNTIWGIPPKLFRNLITATVHAATDYASPAWIQLPINKDFASQLTKIDQIGARKALGALRSTPGIFLYHDLNLLQPETRLTNNTLKFIARISAKPTTHPLKHYFDKAKRNHPKAHLDPFDSFYRHELAQTFAEYLDQSPIDPTNPLPVPNNLDFIIQENKKTAIAGTKILLPSPEHLTIFSNGSRIPGKNTAAAAWCANSRHQHVKAIGLERLHGIFEAEYSSLIMGLRLAQRSMNVTTRRMSLILDNQGVVKDMKNFKATKSSAIKLKNTALLIARSVALSHPQVRIAICWCPSHKGIKGNKIVDKLARKTAEKNLPQAHKSTPDLSAFKAAINKWVNKPPRLTTIESRRLGQNYNGNNHLKALNALPKHLVAAISQLRSSHIPLFAYLHRIQARLDPECACHTGIENPDHFLFICPIQKHHRIKFKKELLRIKVPFDKICLKEPKALAAIADCTRATWRLKARWIWAEIMDETFPEGIARPE